MSTPTLNFKTSDEFTTKVIDHYLYKEYQEHIYDFRVKMRDAGGIPVWDCVIEFKTKDTDLIEEIRNKIEILLGKIEDEFSKSN